MRLIKLGMLAGTSLLVLALGEARAADLSVAKAPPPSVYNWSGLYWGVNVGYSWGAAKYDAVLTGIGSVSRSEDIDGVIGGIQSGYNRQIGAWVLGFESDIQISGQKGGATFPGAFAPTTITTDEKLEWFGTSRARLGFLATPTILLYGTAGAAYGQVKDDATVTTPGVGSFTARFKDVKAGWTAGGGIEGAFGGSWSAKLEYLYVDLGKTQHSFGTIGLGTIATETRHTTDNIVRLGINYRWGG
jgi:outer membrane immunogenic protein